MEYKIVEKAPFTVLGSSKMFGYDNAYEEVPRFWKDHYAQGRGEIIGGTYGVSIDENSDSREFEYLIADDYLAYMDIPDGYKTVSFPALTWAVFPCKGGMPKSLQDINTKIFSEWLPNNRDYEIERNISIEMYSNPKDFPKGNLDENYYCELWIPVKKK